ncbi:zinc-binding dehydrogenase [Simiduia aestuariiviva]|uniref:Alcohol dehydrogenase n=1 Tax=Simiduia aestuariiviva TaxID=1510459 RepID=A0A839UHH2_9GAMM|nr:zinc-binding dehydrogenase [Simiduia aestuariiviva]MBB3167484.1 alcohol dehydrogenase [Simiduia aestuariiviva]
MDIQNTPSTTKKASSERQVWRTKKAGAISHLQLVSEPLTELADDKIRVEVRAVGLNFADIFALTGLYSATPKGSFIPGLEFAGVVVAKGDAVASALQVGDRVYGCIRFGGYASCVDVDPAHCRALSTDWSFEQSAAFPVQSLTAYYALHHLAAVQPGQRVLIHSAAGGVGLQAMAMVRALGAEPIGTVRSESKRDFLKHLGYENVMVREPDFAKQLAQHLQDRPLHAVLDGIGGDVQKASFKQLAPMGRLVVFGAAEFTPGNRPNWLTLAWRYMRRPRYDVMEMISNNTSVLAFNLIWLWQEQALFENLLNGCEALALPAPHVGHTFHFDCAHDAIDCLRSGNSVGKVILSL